MSEKRQIVRDRFKRTILNQTQAHVHGLYTPMASLLATLDMYRAIPQRLNALELFGMHGLWHTRDYMRRCDYLEVWEINPTYAAFASRSLTNSTVVVADSIDAVHRGALKKDIYDFIVIDNPAVGQYGDGYVEHFDLFPSILPYLQEGVIVLNFLSQDIGFDEEQARRREQFYGRLLPTIDEGITTYVNLIKEAGLDCTHQFYAFRRPGVGYLALACTNGPLES